MSDNKFASKFVKIRAGTYRLDIRTGYPDDTIKFGFFCPSFGIVKRNDGWWDMGGDSTLFDPAHERTLSEARSYLDHKIEQLLNPKLLNCGAVTFHRNSGGFLAYETTYTAKNGMQYQVYIQKQPSPTAKFTARAFLPHGELQADGIFAADACCHVTDAIEALHKAQGKALDEIVPTTPLEAPVSTPVDLSWLADDDPPRTDGLYGEYQAALSELDQCRADMTAQGEQRWLTAFERSVTLRQQLVAQEGALPA